MMRVGTSVRGSLILYIWALFAYLSIHPFTYVASLAG